MWCDSWNNKRAKSPQILILPTLVEIRNLAISLLVQQIRQDNSAVFQSEIDFFLRDDDNHKRLHSSTDQLYAGSLSRFGNQNAYHFTVFSGGISHSQAIQGFYSSKKVNIFQFCSRKRAVANHQITHFRSRSFRVPASCGLECSSISLAYRGL